MVKSASAYDSDTSWFTQPLPFTAAVLCPRPEIVVLLRKGNNLVEKQASYQLHNIKGKADIIY